MCWHRLSLTIYLLLLLLLCQLLVSEGSPPPPPVQLNISPRIHRVDPPKVPKETALRHKELTAFTRELLKAGSNDDSQALKICLQKVFVFTRSEWAAVELGKAFLFGFPQDSGKRKQRDGYKRQQCEGHTSDESSDLADLAELQKIDAVSENTRDFGKAMYYFRRAELLKSSDALGFIMFMLEMGYYVENVSDLLDIPSIASYKVVYQKVITVGQYRQAVVPETAFLKDIKHCLGADKLEVDFVDIVQDQFMKSLERLGEDEAAMQREADQVRRRDELPYVFTSSSIIEEDDEIVTEFTEELSQRYSKFADGSRIARRLVGQLDRLVAFVWNYSSRGDEGECPTCEESLVVAINVLADRINRQEEEEYSRQEETKGGDGDQMQDQQTLEGEPPQLGVNQEEEILLQLARNGNLEAQVLLGNDYQFGNPLNGIGRNPIAAEEFYRMAAAQGHAQAIANVALMYLYGNGVEVDVQRARDMFEVAAQAGEPSGQSGLGYMYSNGIGVKKNETLGAEYFLMAAAGGSEEAVLNLAVLYSQGFDHVKANMTLAMELLLEIVDNSQRAQLEVGIELLRGTKMNISCENLLAYIIEEEKERNVDGKIKKTVDGENEKEREEDYVYASRVRREAGQLDDALVYAMYAAFIGESKAQLLVAELWKEHAKRSGGDASGIRCLRDDSLLCSMVFYHRDSAMRTKESLVKVGHQVYAGSKGFEKSAINAFLLYKSAQEYPESLHSMSCLYEEGVESNNEKVQGFPKNIKTAQKFNDLIIKKAMENSIGVENIFPAIIRKIYLFFLALAN